MRSIFSFVGFRLVVSSCERPYPAQPAGTSDIRSHELRELLFSIAAVAAVLPFYSKKKSASIYGVEPLGRVSSGGGLGGERATNRRGNDRSIMRVRTLAQERRA